MSTWAMNRIRDAYGLPRSRQHRPLRFYGLDLGQARDYTALAVISTEKYNAQGHRIEENQRPLALGHIERWPLRTSYPDIVRSVGEFIQGDEGFETYLVVDRGGVGAGVLDLLEEAGLQPWGIFSTAGNEVTHADSPGDNANYNVPKRDLVGAANVAMQTGRLKVSPRMKYARVFKEELENFQVKFTALGNDTYEAVKSGDHDDIVMAVSLAVWAATTDLIGDRFMTWGTLVLPWGRGGNRVATGPEWKPGQ